MNSQCRNGIETSHDATFGIGEPDFGSATPASSKSKRRRNKRKKNKKKCMTAAAAVNGDASTADKRTIVANKHCDVTDAGVSRRNQPKSPMAVQNGHSIDFNTVPVWIRFRLLDMFESYFDDARRAAVASTCNSLNNVERAFFVHRLHVRGNKMPQQQADELRAHGALVELQVDNAQLLPSNFIELLTNLPVESDVSQRRALAHTNGALERNPLQRLSLTRSQSIRNAHLRAVRRLPHLRTLVLRELSTLVCMDFLRALPNPQQLVLLDFQGCRKLTFKPSPQLLDACQVCSECKSQLDRWHANDNAGDGDNGGNRASARSKAQLCRAHRPMPILVGLIELNINGCTLLDYRVLQHVADTSPQLAKLFAARCPWISDVDVVYVRNMPALRFLDLGACGNITSEAVTILSYISNDTMSVMRDYEQLVAQILRCDVAALPRRTDTGAIDFAQLVHDEDDRAVVEFVARHAAQLRNYLPYVFRRRRSIASNETFDRAVVMQFPTLTKIDLSQCRFRSLDLLALCNLVLAQHISVDQCEIFVPFHDIDAIYFDIQRTQQEKEEGANAEQFVRRCAVDEAFSPASTRQWQRHVPAARLSMARCTYSTENVSDVVRWPVETVPDEQRAIITRCPLLFAKHLGRTTALNLSRQTAINHVSLPYVAFWVRQLSELDISHCRNVTDDTLKQFVDIVAEIDARALRSLTAINCRQISGNGVAHLLNKYPHLSALRIDRCTNVTNMALTAVTKSQNALVLLSMANCGKITARVFENTGQIISNVTALDVSGTGFDDHSMQMLPSRMPQLESVAVCNCKKLTGWKIRTFLHNNCDRVKHLAASLAAFDETEKQRIVAVAREHSVRLELKQ